MPCVYIFVYDEDHERYSPLKIMSLKGQMHNYRMKYTDNGFSLILVRSWTCDTMRISWGGVQAMDKSDPVNLPVTVTVALRHKIMTRKITQWLREVQYMLKQGSSWHDITDYYRARKKAVNLKAETGDKEVMQSSKKAEREKSQKKRNRFKRNLLKCKRPYQVRNLKYSSDLLLTFDLKCIVYFSWWKDFRVPTTTTKVKVTTAGNAFGVWHDHTNIFQMKLPAGV